MLLRILVFTLATASMAIMIAGFVAQFV